MLDDSLKVELKCRMEAAGLNAKQLSLRAGLNETGVRDILTGRSRHPKESTLRKLAGTLGCTVDDLLGMGAGRAPAEPEADDGGTIRIPVIGAVEAGVWREAFEWESEDQYAVTAVPDRRYPGMPHFALEVRGPSMDLVYPEGTILICIRYADLAARPQNEDRVICQRVSREGLVEATVKELVIDEDGQSWLWPRSKHPKYQQPIALPHPRANMTEHPEPFHMPILAHAGGHPTAEEVEEISLLARVVASYRPE